MELKYRPEIDGLRTIAVLSVIIYHAEFAMGTGKFLPGGFLGVDVFFVISGFLITSLMMNEFHQTGTISISRFYERRSRRLLPALLLVILASMPFAWLYLLPAQFIDYAWSLISSVLFSSNFYWNYSLQQYGAESALLKPFLHTWSLAVEEQYYIVFPLILLAIYRWTKVHTIFLLTAGLLLSFLFALRMTPQDMSFSFYMLPGRFWELLVGALAANILYVYPPKASETPVRRVMPALGFFLIIYSFLFAKIDSGHPGFMTLIPVIGTVLIIGFAGKNEAITRILSSRPFVYIGLISYSLYLWHYPIFAFFRIDGIFDSTFGPVLAIALTLFLAMASAKYIEKPFRSAQVIPARRFVYLIAAVALLVVGVSCLAVVKQGFPERYKGILATGTEEMREYRRKYWDDNAAYTKLRDFKSDQISIEVIGNSWAQDIANSLVEAGGFQVSFRGSTLQKCKAITLTNAKKHTSEYRKWVKRCRANLGRFYNRMIHADLVIVADNRTLLKVDNKAVSHEILRNIGILRKSGYSGPVLIIANRPLYKKAVFSIVGEYGFSGDGVNKYAQQYLRQPVAELIKTDQLAKSFYNQQGLYYYSLVDSLCAESVCKISVRGKPLYHDEAHLTLSGARFVGLDLSRHIKTNILEERAGELDLKN